MAIKVAYDKHVHAEKHDSNNPHAAIKKGRGFSNKKGKQDKGRDPGRFQRPSEAFLYGKM